MDVNTAADQVDAFLLYDVDDPTAREIIPAFVTAGITTTGVTDLIAQRVIEKETSNLLMRARTIVLLFGKVGWSRRLLELVHWARPFDKPFFVVLGPDADEKALVGEVPWLREIQWTRWVSSESLRPLIAAIEGYRPVENPAKPKGHTPDGRPLGEAPRPASPDKRPGSKGSTTGPPGSPFASTAGPPGGSSPSGSPPPGPPGSRPPSASPTG
ncbi:MAG TPA: hypothetical protein VF915_09275, partial [Reyranella sp.]